MRAALFRTTGPSSVLEYVTNAAKPSPTAGQLLVRNHFVGINFIDTYHRTGLYKVPLPFTPGREAAGVVEAIGAGVHGFAVGDRVAYMGPNTCAEYALASQDQIIRLPDDVPLDIAAALLLQGCTAMSLVKLAYEVKKGDYVLIHAAAGGTGQMLVQICKEYGAIVIGTTSSAAKAETVQRAGADHVILYTQQNVKEEVMKITNGRGVNVVYDGIGKSTFDVSLSCLGLLGTLASFGNASGKVDDVDIMKLVPNAVRLMRPSLFAFIKNREDFDFLAKPLMQLYAEGKIAIQIHEIYDLEDIKRAHDDLEDGNPCDGGSDSGDMNIPFLQSSNAYSSQQYQHQPQHQHFQKLQTLSLDRRLVSDAGAADLVSAFAAMSMSGISQPHSLSLPRTLRYKSEHPTTQSTFKQQPLPAERRAVPRHTNQQQHQQHQSNLQGSNQHNHLRHPMPQHDGGNLRSRNQQQQFVNHQNDKKSNLYKTEFCRSMEETGDCRYGAKCQFAHSREELRMVDRHPKYKTQVCKTFFETGDCPYGRRCCFIHSPSDRDEVVNGHLTSQTSPSKNSSASYSAVSPPVTPSWSSGPTYMKLLGQNYRFTHQQTTPPGQIQQDGQEPVIHSVTPTAPSLLLKHGVPVPSLNNMPNPSISSPSVFQNVARSGSPSVTSSLVPFTKSNPSPPTSGATSTIVSPSRRRVSDLGPITAAEFQLMRTRQQSYPDIIAEEVNLPLRSLSQDDFSHVIHRQHQPQRSSLSSARGMPIRLGTSTPTQSAYEAQQHDQLEQQQILYNTYQQHQLAQFENANFASSLESSVSSLSSQFPTPPDTTLLATSAQSSVSGVDSLFFDNAVHQQLQQHQLPPSAGAASHGLASSMPNEKATPSICASNGRILNDNFGFIARPAGSGMAQQRRTRSVTQPVTQSEELEEFFYLQQQMPSNLSSLPSVSGSVEKGNGFQSNGELSQLFEFDGEGIVRPFSAQPDFLGREVGSLNSRGAW
ncbi:hypothetical protein HDU84_002138 [Entophlyctis sp. JEL0112]|nr:hypothetical protein HDU84_002138 [Entophlyctis sp. JEL0112]